MSDDDSWICPMCGFLNPHTLRVAMKDICINCKEEKQDVEEFERNYDKQMDEIHVAMMGLSERRGTLLMEIDNLNAEIADLKVKLRPIDQEWTALEEERTSLERKFATIRKTTLVNGRRITGDQKTLV